MSYAIYWKEGEAGPRYAGRLDLGDSSVELSGSALGRRMIDSVSLGDISSVRLSAGDLRISRRNGAALDIGSVEGLGSLRELADCLALARRARGSLALEAR